MLKIKKHIPNFITLLNLLSGSIGIIFLLKNQINWAAGMIWAAAIFDFLDGLAARLLCVKSTIGKELDSLADVVSFGLLPSLMVFHLLESGSRMSYYPYMAFLIVVFSALRLAKFNVDTRQTESFIGLPVPANAIMISSFPFISAQYDFFMFSDPTWLLLVTIILSYLLVSNIPLFSFKLKGLGWKENRIKYIYLMTSVILLLIFHIAAIPIIITLYIVFSIVSNYLSGSNR